MKKAYLERPELYLINLSVADVITSSAEAEAPIEPNTSIPEGWGDKTFGDDWN